MTHLVYLSLGSNLGNREANLRSAMARLNQVGRVVSVSSFYETEPVEFTAQPLFLNCALAFETMDKPAHLLNKVLTIEREMGRTRTEEQRKGPRIIDIDILLFDHAIRASPALTIPHPAMHQRRFVLEPLAEIAPQARHPLLQKTIQELVSGLPAGPSVRRLPVNASEEQDR